MVAGGEFISTGLPCLVLSENGVMSFMFCLPLFILLSIFGWLGVFRFVIVFFVIFVNLFIYFYFYFFCWHFYISLRLCLWDFPQAQAILGVGKHTKISPPTKQIKNWTYPLKIKILQRPTIVMWDVYPEATDCNVGAVCSDFNLGERIWR